MMRRLFPFLCACSWLFSAAIGFALTGAGLTGRYCDTDAFGTLKTTRTDAAVDCNRGTAIASGTALTAANTSEIASVSAATGYWQRDVQPSQHSAARTLVAGQRYHVELLHKKGGATARQAWRVENLGTIGNSGMVADTFDSNGDGESYLLELATAQDQNAGTPAMSMFSSHAGTLEFNCKRSSAAIDDGVSFAVEWSVTLASNSWSSAGVTEQVVADKGVVQTEKATVPSGMSRRFLHLKAYKQ